ncbi:MAG: aspartate/glutamate racemase family protein, partial [Pseudomonadota bacterium]
MKTVGVIGGMGPEAMVLFMSHMVGAVPAKDDADHAPLLVDQNPAVLSRIAALVDGEASSTAPTLLGMARGLEDAGAEALVMPCNTVHHYGKVIADAASMPFISMVEFAVARAAVLSPGKLIGLLGSPALASIDLFGAPIAAKAIRTISLQDPDATVASIRSLKANGASSQVTEQLSREAHAMAQAGAQAICICCTEFSLVARNIQAPSRSSTRPTFWSGRRSGLRETGKFSKRPPQLRHPLSLGRKNQYENLHNHRLGGSNQCGRGGDCEGFHIGSFSLVKVGAAAAAGASRICP